MPPATGNRQSRIDGSAATAYAYPGGSHRLSAVGAQSRGYDAVGNTLSIGGGASGGPGGGSCGGVGDNCDYEPPPPDPGHDPPPGGPGAGTESSAGTASSTGAGAAAPALREFVYNAANRMSEVRHDGAVAMQYRYNGLGEQVLKFSAGRRTVTVYDESGRWIGDYDSATGNPIQQAIWLHDLPVGLLVGSGASQTLYYIEPDMLGTPRVVLNPTTSQAVWRWDLTGEAFGDTAPNQDPDGDGQAFVFDMRFPGQRFDAATGLSYNYFRDYEASAGRYVESDPIGLHGGISTYGYVLNNPNIHVDESGLSANNDIKGGCAGRKCGGGRASHELEENAARAILKRLNPVTAKYKLEICGFICKDNSTGMHFISGVVVGSSIACNPSLRPCPACSTAVAYFHTHPDTPGYANERFSSDDYLYADKNDINGYLATPSNILVKYYFDSGKPGMRRGAL